MSVYLHDIPLPEAQTHLNKALQDAGLDGILFEESIPLDESALGRVLSAPIWAEISSPNYHASAMDGFAVFANDTHGASQTSPIELTVGEQARYLDTGDPLLGRFNAVIPIENTEPLDASGALSSDPRKPDRVRIRAAVVPWQHVRPMGEDMVATQLVLPAGQVLRPADLGAIAGSGHSRVKVAGKPRVAIIPTGTELVKIGKSPKTGEIIEYNSMVLAAQVREWGGEATRFPIIPDDRREIIKQVKTAARDHHLILLNAGSSAGSEDYSASVVEELGELLVHGVAVRPGHPVILGMIHKKGGGKVPIVGVPGFPVSAALTGEIFIEPLIARWLGRSPREPDIISAVLTRKIASPGGDDDFRRVVVGQVEGRTLAAPLSRGAGVISSLVRADGLALIPRGTQGEEAGVEVTVSLYRSRGEIARTILAIGSHDLTLDLLAQFLSAHNRRLASANAGSLGGLIALKRGEAHLAGSHLLDPESGEYNLPYLSQYLPDVPVRVIGLVGRQQGLIVAKGNPKKIQGLEDLSREDVTYVNRQRGAGTRILLDYHLGRLGIKPADIRGYGEEEYTHLAVAVAVSSGRADCGLGIYAVADALEMDFIPLYKERYDLVVPEEIYHSPLLAPLWQIISGPDFKKEVETLPGYDIENLGKIIAIVG
jgi:putative molybdopterin biosynthesis protein